MQRTARHRQRAVLYNKGRLNSVRKPSPRLPSLPSYLPAGGEATRSQFETTQGGCVQVNMEERDKKILSHRVSKRGESCVSFDLLNRGFPRSYRVHSEKQSVGSFIQVLGPPKVLAPVPPLVGF